MANSTYIKEVVEPVMRERLSAEIGVALRPKRMQISWKDAGTGSFDFDAVSEDGSVIACCSSAKGLKTGQRDKLTRDATFMWLVPNAERRILAVVEEGVRKALQSLLDRGLLPPGTEIFLVDLPNGIRAQLEEFRAKAAKEVGG